MSDRLQRTAVEYDNEIADLERQLTAARNHVVDLVQKHADLSAAKAAIDGLLEEDPEKARKMFAVPPPGA